MRTDGEKLMALIGKLVVFAFLFLLTGLAVTWANPTTGVGTTPQQLTQDQQKLCLNCHSPRDPPNDTTHIHTGIFAMMDPGAPCWVCHGEGQDPNGEQDTHNGDNLYHPTAEEAAAVGKDILNCTTCHYRHDIIAELASGSLTPPPPSNSSSGVGVIAPSITIWAPMIGAGVSLITGISMIGVLFSVRRRGAAKGGS